MEKKVKVCHVASAHTRYDVRIFQKECKSLAINEFDVYFLVNDSLQNEEIDGVKIISTNFLSKNRLDRMVKSKKAIRKKMLEIDADLYHFHDPDLLFEANWIKGKGKKVIFDFHEDVSAQILYKEWIPSILRKLISKSYSIFETFNAKNFDGIITVTPKFVERLSKINNNTIMVTNYPIIVDNFEQNSNQNVKKRAVCFAGGVSKQWSHENIISALSKVDDIVYTLAGGGNEQYIDILKSNQNWSKVNYLGKIPFNQVKEIYNESIVGMSLLSFSTQVGDEGTLGNTKLFEFMEAGIPVICSNNRLWKDIIDKYKCGIAIDPENIDEIANAINYIIGNPEKAKIMGENGKNAVQSEFSWSTQETKLLDLYNNLI